MIEVSTQELSLQDADLLPTREALDFNSWIAALNVAVADSDGDGDAVAIAKQTIVVIQGEH